MSKVHKACECLVQNKVFYLDNIRIETFRANAPLDNEPDPLQIADEIINNAKEKACKIIEDADKEALEIIEKVRAEAYAEGLESGKSKALQEYSKIIDEAVAFLIEMQEEKKNYLSEMETKLVNLSIKIAEKVINQEIESDKNIFVSLLSGAISKANGCESMKITVNPVQLEGLSEIKSTLMSRLKTIKSLELCTDEALTETDCLIHTECGVIDAGVKTQISRISEALKENREVI